MREMKDSGITWLGEIPENWRLVKGKYMFTQRNTRGNSNELQLLSPTQNYGVIPQSLYEELSGMVAVKLNEKADLQTMKTIHKGDYCISLRSFQGGFEYSEYEGVVSPAYQVFYPTVRISDGFYKYLFKDKGFIEKMNSYTMTLRDGKNIAFADFGNTYIPLPTVDEQQSIATYLDKKCAEIDALTADIQTQIDTLEQYKRSVITEAVTKGLNPDVEMKDSGIEWVGHIPAHWTVHPVYTYFGERKNKNRLGQGDNLLSLSYGRVIRKDINTSDGLLPESFNTYNIVEAGDIIIRPTDLQNDKRSLRTGLVREHGIITSAYIDLMPIKRVDSRYFHYLLHTFDVMKVFYNMGNGVRQGLNYSEFSRLMVFEPPYDEQVAMADFLDVKTAEIDSIIDAKKEQLSVVGEYKKSLIFEYVTGKKEVPSASVVTTAIYPYSPAALNAKKPRFAQAVLMSKILDSGCTNMGRVKLEKMLYVIEYQLGFDFDTQYTRAAAGPLSPSIYECEGIISNRNKWFSINKARHSISYYPAKDMAKYRAYYKKYYAPYDAEICRIIGIFKNFTLDQAEVIATLFGAWNDFLINHKTFTDDDIVDEVWNNWNESKQRFPKDMWLRAIEKMKQLGITPKGYGKLTITKKEAPSA